MRHSTTRFIAVALFIFTPLIQAHHVPLPDGMSETEAAWLWGYHTIPASITHDDSAYWYNYSHNTDASKIDDPAWTEVAAGHIRHGARAPAVLVLHGCSGMFPSPNSYRVFFVEHGFAILEPDSFARPGHSCEHSPLQDRIEDLEYAFEKVRELPWVDQDRILLMGISQGGRVASRWNKPGFAAHIILANNCEGGQPGAPLETPVLAVIGENDEYYAGSCDLSGRHAASRSIVIPGAPHAIIDHEETAQAMEALLYRAGLL